MTIGWLLLQVPVLNNEQGVVGREALQTRLHSSLASSRVAKLSRSPHLSTMSLPKLLSRLGFLGKHGKSIDKQLERCRGVEARLREGARVVGVKGRSCGNGIVESGALS